VDDKEQNEGGPYEATPHADLIAQILDCRVPKNEREWAAGREIDRLTEMVDQLTHFIETNPVQLVADLRRELAEERESHEQLQARCFDGNGSQSVFDAVVQARRELAEAQRERDERMRWIRELWEACEVNGCLPDSGVADEIRTAMIADAAMPAP